MFALVVGVLREGGDTRIYDPGDVEAATGADIAVVLTEWNEFRAIDLKALAATMRGNVLVDLRNIYHRSDAAAAGLTYHSIGRPRPAGR